MENRLIHSVRNQTVAQGKLLETLGALKGVSVGDSFGLGVGGKGGCWVSWIFFESFLFSVTLQIF